MRKELNILGEKYGNLTVIDYHAPIFVGKFKKTAWRCECDCGNLLVMRTDTLRSGRANSCPFCELKINNVEVTNELRSFLDGLLLGDGNFCHNKISAKFQMSQSSIHNDWIELIERKFEKFGVIVKRNIRPAHVRISKGKIINAQESIYLRSLHYKNLIQEVERWYPNGIKIIPKDINLLDTELLANWYMGDGYFDRKRYDIKLATNCFTLEDVQWIKNKMNDYYDLNISVHRHGTKHIIGITSKIHVIKFLDIVKPHIIKSFNYKVI